MKVLVLGSGGREHALAWKLSKSPLVTELVCAPGNPGTAALARNVAVKIDDPDAVLRLVRELRSDLVVVGPEAPLVAGVADLLVKGGVPVFGPSQAAARMEGSKAFAKEVMAAAGVPTAEYRSFTDAAEAARYARERGRIVVKADGLAAGKGVVVAQNAEEAVEGVRQLSALGAAGTTLVLEELMEGEEVSVIALCDGERYALLPPAQDHKRIFDGDQGPNTGGMGAYAPAPFLDRAGVEEVGRTVIAPTLRELTKRGSPFRGALYAGLMLTPQGVRVVEFNCRFGDPETQVMVLQLDEDLAPLLDACARGTLAQRQLKWANGASIGVVLAARGYPQAPALGDEIRGLDAAQGLVFHAGTRQEDGKIVSAGGRVLTVCAQGDSLQSARESAYRTVARIQMEGAQFRKDIGARALR